MDGISSVGAISIITSQSDLDHLQSLLSSDETAVVMATITTGFLQELRDRTKATGKHRAIGLSKKQQYRKDMESSNWHLIGDTVKITKSGWLCDGNHRAQAAIDCGKPLTTFLALNVPDDAIHVIDTGKVRSKPNLAQLNPLLPGSDGPEQAIANAFVLGVDSRNSQGRSVSEIHTVWAKYRNAIQAAKQLRGAKGQPTRLSPVLGAFARAFASNRFSDSDITEFANALNGGYTACPLQHNFVQMVKQRLVAVGATKIQRATDWKERYLITELAIDHWCKKNHGISHIKLSQNQQELFPI